MPLFGELKLRNKYEQDGPSLGRLHGAAQTREFPPLPRSPAVRVGTSLCQESLKS